MEIGLYNTLKILRKEAKGLILSDGQTEILLPLKEIPAELPESGELKVFVYNSDRETVRATTMTPRAIRGEFGLFTVKEVNTVGAFLDWGIPKDLFLPFGAQKHRVAQGDQVMVFVAFDSRKTGIIAFSHLDPFLSRNFSKLKEGQKVKVLIRDFNKNGARVIVEDRYSGLVYKQDFDGVVKPGQVRDGWIRQIRKDGKLDVGLWEKNIQVADKFKEVILARLEENGGHLPYTDKTSPEQIREQLGMSKRMFKMAAGILMKEGKIRIHEKGLSLADARVPKTLKVKARDLNELVMPGYDMNAPQPEKKGGRPASRPRKDRPASDSRPPRREGEGPRKSAGRGDSPRREPPKGDRPGRTRSEGDRRPRRPE